jgi:hypothetical protein
VTFHASECRIPDSQACDAKAEALHHTFLSYFENTQNGERRQCARLHASGERLRAFALPGGHCHGLALGITGFIRQAAAVFGKKTYQRIHMLDIWTVVQITALTPALHEASVNELFQVEGKRWSGDVQPLDQL